MSLRSVWWHSTAEAHLVACVGTALFVPTLGLAPLFMVRRGLGGGAATHHLCWSATITSLLIASGALLGRVLPDLMVGHGPLWAAHADTLRVVGAMWLFVAFCTPVLLSFVHGLVACRLYAGFKLRLRRRVTVAVPPVARPEPAQAEFRAEDFPTGSALLVIRSATSRCLRARVLLPSLTLEPMPDAMPLAPRGALVPVGAR